SHAGEAAHQHCSSCVPSRSWSLPCSSSSSRAGSRATLTATTSTGHPSPRQPASQKGRPSGGTVVAGCESGKQNVSCDNCQPVAMKWSRTSCQSLARPSPGSSRQTEKQRACVSQDAAQTTQPSSASSSSGKRTRRPVAGTNGSVTLLVKTPHPP